MPPALTRRRVADAAAELAMSRGHVVERALVKPTLGNLLLWRSVYEVDGRFYVDAIRVGMSPGPVVFEGTSIARFSRPEMDAAVPPGSRKHTDLLRFEAFSDGYLARIPERSATVGDIRYASLPNDVQPVWGVELDDDPATPVRFRFYREFDAATRERFVAMLFPD